MRLASRLPIRDSEAIGLDWSALEEEAERNQSIRAIHSCYVYPVLPPVLAITTTYPHEHPTAFWAATVALVGSILLRLVLILGRPRIYPRSPRLWRALFYSTIVAAAAGCGILFSYTILTYGFESWAFTICMVWVLGVGSGATITFTPNNSLLRVHLCLVILPPLMMSLYLGGEHGNTFALASGILFAFLIGQGYGLHKNYWRQMVDRALESARTRELEIAKQSAEAAREAAEAASRSKSLFLANMSHEIRTPMHGILGMSQIVLATPMSEEQRDCMITLHHSAEGLLHVLNDILDFSKIEANKLTLESVPFNLRALMAETRKLMAPQADAKGLDFDCRTSNSVPDLVKGDPVRLRQVLVNLIGNAIKFTSEGSVRVVAELNEAAAAGGRVGLRFEIADTGVGIPEDQQKTIFDAFAQVDSSVTRRFGGTGLGLAICSELVSLMSGTIGVTSVPGAGSRFFFTCALEQALEKAEPVNALMSPAVTRNVPARILLAEDNPVNQKVAKALLGKMGHDVRVVSNGIEAVRAWEQERFDVILMDNQMPEMGGIEAAQRIRSLEAESGARKTAILALTASAMRGDRERFLAAGMDGYLAKPFRADELYSVIAGLTAPQDRHDRVDAVVAAQPAVG